MSLQVQPFHHAATGTWTYLVSDIGTDQAAIIDPVLDYDAATGRTDTMSAQAVLNAARDLHLDVRWLLETHAHADHLTAAQWLKTQFPQAKVAIGRGIRNVQRRLAPDLGLNGMATDGSQFDHLFDDGDMFHIGTTAVKVIAVPGHTRDSLAYLVEGNRLFCGDSLFMPDSGTARCDFPGGDAATLFASIQRLFALPEATRVLVGHDYGHETREPGCISTIGEQKRDNIHVGGDATREQFVAMRSRRDATLSPPALLTPALRCNLNAGVLPA